MHDALSADLFLEYAFVRWVLTPAVQPAMLPHVVPQRRVDVAGHTYKIDYEFVGQERTIAVELDGFEFHGNRQAFT